VKLTTRIVRLKHDGEEQLTDDGGCSTRWQHVQQRNPVCKKSWHKSKQV